MKTLISFGLCLCLIFSACIESPRYSPDGKLSINLHEPNVSIPDMLELIQKADQTENKIRSTMFYVMENDRSNVMYELKATSRASQADIVLVKMEAMAGSVRFDHD